MISVNEKASITNFHLIVHYILLLSHEKMWALISAFIKKN